MDPTTQKSPDKLGVKHILVMIGPWAIALAFGGSLFDLIRLIVDILRLIEEILRGLLICRVA